MDSYLNLMFPLGRRELLKWAGLVAAGTIAEPLVRPLEVRAQGRTKPAGTARNAIMIEMSGAISPMDCWDLKETKTTPKDLDPQKIWSDFYLSKTFFPKLIESGLINRCSFVRSMLGRELIHLTGQYRVQTGRSINPAVAKEIPGFGSIIAYELESQRRETDTLPTYMSTNLSRNSTGLIGAGFLPNRSTASTSTRRSYSTCSAVAMRPRESRLSDAGWFASVCLRSRASAMRSWETRCRRSKCSTTMPITS